MEKTYPLILVFYLDRLLMSNPQIMTDYAKLIEDTIAAREANAMAFFLPTDDKERIECINPIYTTEEQNKKIEALIEDIKKSFDIGQGADDFKEEEE